MAIFIGAVITDLTDGMAARHHGRVTALGGLFDHSTDALFVSVNLTVLAATGDLPLLLPVLIVGAFIQYTLDSRALAGQKLRMSKLGKYNGITYFVLLGVTIARHLPPFEWIQGQLIHLFAWILVVTTLVSMFDRARALLKMRTK